MARRVTMHEQIAPPARTGVFVPSKRPPTPVLIALDDGSATDGESWRLRTTEWVIGRKEGDTVIGHDPSVSSKHAQLKIERDGVSWYWKLVDLGSRNGTFLRVEHVCLGTSAELLVADTRLQFHAKSGGVAEQRDYEATQVVAPPVVSQAAASVRVIRSTGLGPEIPLVAGETWLGASPGATGVVLEDPFAEPRHARITTDAKGRWWIADAKSVNGVWLRVDQARLAGGAEFRLGEQRFRFLLPGNAGSARAAKGKA